MRSNKELAEALERKMNGARCIRIGEYLAKDIVEALRNSVRKEESE